VDADTQIHTTSHLLSVIRDVRGPGQAGLRNSPSKTCQARTEQAGMGRVRPKRLGLCGQQLVTNLIIIIIIIMMIQFIKCLRPWLQRHWRQVSRGCYSKALRKKYDLNLDLGDYCLRQQVPDSWRRTTKSSSHKVCPGERLVQQWDGRRARSSTQALT